MRFQKINDNVIRCIISQEEMHRRGIELEDLMDNRAKAEEFLQYVLAQARYEVNFVTRGDLLNVQLSVLQDGEISMMISDDTNAAVRAITEQFREKLKAFQEALERQISEKKGKLSDKDRSKEKLIQSFLEEKKEDEILDFDFWVRLETLDDAIHLARELPSAENIPSTLYRYEDSYYIYLQLRMTKAQIARHVFILTEYTKDLYAKNPQALVIKEHGEVISEGHAIHDLAALG